MGGLCTCCRPQVPKDRNSTIKHHGSILHRRTSISAAFSYEPNNPSEVVPLSKTHATPLPTIFSTLDINTATEEDLMTLPMIGRVIAHNIVEYRKQIGCFRRVEDLALVSGIGATKLEKLRKEIHVSTSTANAAKSLLHNSESNSSVIVDINSASAAQFSNIEGISDELAAKIVNYRNTNGSFHHINDLVEPSGLIDVHTLLKIKGFLAISKNSGKHSRNASSASSIVRNTASNISFGIGPESIESHRARVESFNSTKSGRPIIRIGTWNLQQFGLEKVQNPGVREVVCATILETGIKILVVQELSDAEALQEIVDELNSPTLPNIQRLKGNSGLWRCMASRKPAGRMYQSAEYNGFIWDSAASINLYSSSLLEKTANGRDFVRCPFLGYFKILKMDVVLVSVHLKAVGHVGSETDLERLNKEIRNLQLLVEALKKKVPEEKDLVILGDFNLEPNKADFDILRNQSFKSIVRETVPTNISSKNMKGSRCYDNIWLSDSAAKLYTGAYQVVRNGLTNPWIPDGWRWGGVASDHCPVWVELFTDKDFDAEAANKSLEGLQLKP
ncbi:endonuclease/exonuclease/phosphatase family domain-containing protein 1-like isoform X1 [Clavelina lepadiformis]|uniref:endonuclease/exonuclease/phosphatase family domain-containing protein 1-like isoform X1 n=1 Tax=Clavelina lepadiformis TaxID=159417 RepID=UPI0040410561